jgi:hypothetical protein
MDGGTFEVAVKNRSDMNVEAQSDDEGLCCWFGCRPVRVRAGAPAVGDDWIRKSEEARLSGTMGAHSEVYC